MTRISHREANGIALYLRSYWIQCGTLALGEQIWNKQFIFFHFKCLICVFLLDRYFPFWLKLHFRLLCSCVRIAYVIILSHFDKFL